MIVHHQLKNVNSPFIFSGLPYYELENQEICLLELCIEYEKNCGNNNRFSFQSSLIERSAANPSQLLASFLNRKSEKLIQFIPANKQYYKCEGYNLNEAVFRITPTKNQENKIISLYLQLEIIDARL